MRGRCDAETIPELPETFWAYFAGFIDGEGSITMCQNGPRLIVSNNHRDTLEWFKNSLGGFGSITTNGKCNNLNYGSNAIRAILPKVIPYLRIKRKRAEILLGYLKTVVPRGGNYEGQFQVLRDQVKQQMLAAEG